jgi:hypothetical protein
VVAKKKGRAKASKLLVVTHATSEDVIRAKDILGSIGGNVPVFPAEPELAPAH